jgi:NAD(P)H-dependent FMN reductase
MGKKIVAFGASSARQSINKFLAHYAASLVQDAEVIELDLADVDLPIYSIDLEGEIGIPVAAKELLSAIQSADGLIISIAEHNGTYSSAFKNAFDWMSRIDGKLWANIPMVLLSTSPGPRGGSTALEIAANRFPYMGGNIVGKLVVPSFTENFQGGKLINEELNKNLIEQISNI